MHLLCGAACLIFESSILIGQLGGKLLASGGGWGLAGPSSE